MIPALYIIYDHPVAPWFFIIALAVLVSEFRGRE